MALQGTPCLCHRPYDSNHTGDSQRCPISPSDQLAQYQKILGCNQRSVIKRPLDGTSFKSPLPNADGV
eukprot:2643765-Amphidinium_carterae.1